MRLKIIFDKLIDLFYPRRAVCMGCGSMLGCDADDLCDVCRQKLAEHFIGPHKLQKGSGLDEAAFAYPYRGPAGSMVRKLKYSGVAVLSQRMGEDIARAVFMLHLSDTCVVTAVPMHPKRLRQRGRNHAELIARQTATALGLTYADILYRTRNAPQQARLSLSQRLQNLNGAFAVRPEYSNLVNNGSILLIEMS